MSFFRPPALFAAVAFLALSATACSGIRVVQRTPSGGVVALRGLRDGAREKADAYMREQCPGGYHVEEEGEAVVGQETTSSVTQGSRGTSWGTASTRDVREWRIVYRCGEDRSAEARTLVVPM